MRVGVLYLFVVSFSSRRSPFSSCAWRSRRTSSASSSSPSSGCFSPPAPTFGSSMSGTQVSTWGGTGLKEGSFCCCYCCCCYGKTWKSHYKGLFPGLEKVRKKKKRRHFQKCCKSPGNVFIFTCSFTLSLIKRINSYMHIYSFNQTIVPRSFASFKV